MYCIEKLFDYVSAIYVLKKCEQIDKKQIDVILNLIKQVGDSSPLVRGMILESEGKYEESIESYYECINSEKFDYRVLGRLGRIYAILGDTEDLKETGIKMMRNASALGDQFSSFNLGLIYRSKSKSDSAKRNEYLKESIKYFEFANEYPDSYLQNY